MTKCKKIASVLAISLFIGGCAKPIMNQQDKESAETSKEEEQKASNNEKSEKDKQTNDFDSARNIALSDAGVSESDVYFEVETQYSKHDNAVAKFVFKDSNRVYVYEIDINSGEIYFSKVNQMGGRNHNYGYGNHQKRRDNDTDPSDYITSEEAKRIALDSVNLNENEVAIIKLKLDDYGNRMPKYEVEFKAKGLEYEFEIDAFTGDIIEMEIDD